MGSERPGSTHYLPAVHITYPLWSQQPICEMGLLCLPTPCSLKVK